MGRTTKLLVVRLLPVISLMLAITVWIDNVQQSGPHVLRNLLPLLLAVLLSGITLHRGNGRWTGTGWSWPLGTLGFAIPACGLSIYLHYAYSVNLNDMFAEGAGQLFRFLPVYTLGAGGIGFMIGWIVGRNV